MGLEPLCDQKSLNIMLYGIKEVINKQSDITQCCTTGSLPTHAELATIRCGAVGTMNPWSSDLNRNREEEMKTASMNAVRELGWTIRQTYVKF